MTWSDSIVGAVGSGSSLTLELLEEGTHTMTLTVTDSDGMTATAEVTITVGDVDADIDVGMSINPPKNPLPPSSAASTPTIDISKKGKITRRRTLERW